MLWLPLSPVVAHHLWWACLLLPVLLEKVRLQRL